MNGRLVQYAVAATLVRLADEGARVALPLLALSRTGSAAPGGALVAALLVPHVLAAPAVGVVADRARRPPLVVASAGLAFAASLAVAAALVGRAPLAYVLVVLVAGGCGGPALTGALSSQLSGLVPAGQLPRAFGLDSLTYNGAGIAGPAVAAVIAGVWSATAATVALAAAAGVGALLIAVLPTDPTTVERAAGFRRTGHPLLAGVRAFARDRVLAAVTVATSVGQIGIGALSVVVVVVAARQGDPEAAGWLLTAMAGGALLGSLAWTWRPVGPSRAPAVVMVGLVAAGAPIALAAAEPGLAVTAALFAVSGFADGPLFGALLVTRQHRAPAAVRSQVFTLGAGLKITAAAAGAAAAGLAAGAPSGTLLLGAGACMILAGAVGALAVRREGGFARAARVGWRPARR